MSNSKELHMWDGIRIFLTHMHMLTFDGINWA